MEEEQKIGVIALIRDEYGKYLIVKRSDDLKYEPGKWAFVGGTVEFGENPKNALKREVMEEVGIEISDIEILNIDHGTFLSVDRKIKRHSIHLSFLCKAASDKIKINKEITEFRWLIPKDISKLDLMKGNEKF